MFGQSSRFFVSLCSLCAFAVCLSGCNKAPDFTVSGANGAAIDKTATPADVSNFAQTSSVVPTKTNDQTSPAAKVNELPVPEAEPDQVCKRFMEFLQSGNRISAENLLTKTALTTTTRAELTLEPMGGQTSVYEFNEVRYATNKKKLAQVDCAVVENLDGESYRMEMTWVVRKQSSGWRISGVMLELEPGTVKDFLSFENPQDVLRMKMLAGSDVIEDSGNETRQANAKQKTIK